MSSTNYYIYNYENYVTLCRLCKSRGLYEEAERQVLITCVGNKWLSYIFWQMEVPIESAVWYKLGYPLVYFVIHGSLEVSNCTTYPDLSGQIKKTGWFGLFCIFFWVTCLLAHSNLKHIRSNKIRSSLNYLQRKKLKVL